jgi:hypothetical protein
MNQDFINIYLPINAWSRKTYRYDFSKFSGVLGWDAPALNTPSGGTLGLVLTRPSPRWAW